MKRIALILLFTILMLPLFSSCSRAKQPLTAEEHLSFGEKYLLELNYEQALVHFLAVIEIEPMNSRGYTGTAEAYIGLDDTDSAVTILRDGLRVLPDDVVIRDALDKLLSVSIDLPESEMGDPFGSVENENDVAPDDNSDLFQEGTFFGEKDNNGRFIGWGVWTYHNFRYEGYFLDGAPSGEGTLTEYYTVEPGFPNSGESIEISISGTFSYGRANGTATGIWYYPNRGEQHYFSFLLNDGYIASESEECTDCGIIYSFSNEPLYGGVPPWASR